MKANESDKILGWHFRNVDATPGGREEYARRFPLEYNRVIDTIEGRTGFILVAEDEGQLTGYIGIRIDKEPSPSRAFLSGFYVDPHQRRKGYGRALAEKAVKVAQQKGASSLSVEVGLQKPWLVTFYESVGFLPSSITMYQDLVKDS